MNRFKLLKQTALVLSATMLLAGCASGSAESSQTTATETQTSTKSGSGTESSTEQSGSSTAQDQDAILKDGQKDTLTVVFPGGSSSPADLEAVEAGLQSVVDTVMDATVKLNILEWGVFSDQQKLMLSSGEDIALMFTYDSSKNYAASSQVLDITDLVNTYASDALTTLGKYAEACQISGRYYGLPTFHEYTKDSGLVCRTDILEALGVDSSSITSWDDIEALLAKVKAAYPDMNILAPVELEAGVLPYYNEGLFDILTDGVAVRVDGDGSEVVDYYDTDEFMELAKVAYDWNQKGYFMPDATTVTDTRQDLLAAGNTFGYVGQIHPGTATQELKNSGVAVTTIPVGHRALTTGNVNFAQYMVPTSSSTPEKAVKLLDLMLTNADVSNLLMYGVEGKDYVVKDAQTKVAGYPDGVDSSSVGWNNETWLAGNGSLAYAWESDPVDIWQQYQTFNDSATVSPLYGFTFDTSNVKTEITAITNVISKYKAVICSGYSDPESSVKQMVDELNSAGIANIITEAQAQISNWKAGN
ncbi:ABC transporter substrate-binding protein [Oscillospiraceae bacterium HV4-5-C5C]|nr:ABC transporter substrate-binding protein [Oscillospiraceae bacterium HV4-5-C5C]